MVGIPYLFNLNDAAGYAALLYDGPSTSVSGDNPAEVFGSATYVDDNTGDSIRYLSDAYARYEEVRCDWILVTVWFKSSYGFYSDNSGVTAENINQYR